MSRLVEPSFDLEHEYRLAGVGGSASAPDIDSSVQENRSRARVPPFGAQVPSHGGRKRTALVFEAVQRRGAVRFFMRGRSCLTQVAIASSSRSTARRAGRCSASTQPLTQNGPRLRLA